MRIALIAMVGLACGASSSRPDPLEPFIAGYAGADRTTALVRGELAVPCLGRVTAEFQTNIVSLATNLRAGRRILDEAGIVPEADFCEAFGQARVLLVDEDRVATLGGSQTGLQDITGSITLPRATTENLLHELLHYWDWRHFQVGTVSHAHWSQNGYYDATRRYEAAQNSIWVPE